MSQKTNAFKGKTGKLEELNGKENCVHWHKIMVIDDEEPAIRTMVSLLGNTYDVITASNGQEGLDKIQAMPHPEKISLIICDQRMPNLTGIQFFMKVKRIIPNTLRILLTAFDDSHVRIDAIKLADVYEFIIKPPDPPSLLVRVKNAIKHFEQQNITKPS